MKKISILILSFHLVSACFAQDIKAYQNYDFIAGDKIIFTDDFSDSQTGEFSTHWKLNGGQAVVNIAEDEKAFFITKYYTALLPRVKTPNYLPKEFTIEFDTWLDAAYDSNNGVSICFKNGEDCSVQIITNNSQWICSTPDGRLTGELPKSLVNDAYFNKWHHVAIAVKGGQIKIYCDQYRVLVVPEVSFKANMLIVTGDASDGMNMMFKNFKLAAGGDMNMIGKAFTDGKYVSHGINFDVNKSTIKPASMGEINSIAKILKDNTNLKIEISGHTDTDGDDASNLKLSEARAIAVKNQLVSMGIDSNRLTTKGYGETKPITSNTTFEGKAENRRVEFVKM
ncbi:Peptidoglycan-associated lipoprotein [Emticicia aquatica]|jgi:outer membrane protein OmpA-like peptidoglycan-associated protein|uniref:Peptidoglycan-associated lipoprotein n=1 Tax=Emticicia aquatica TaxID=1681835 RepID=A0ABM9AMN7_9BACT|nr:OmpA family protein [Emticicia aquatica]CAH0994524.1 Peptidoglycan-associated lipoprotein [Emticicia aquatica]